MNLQEYKAIVLKWILSSETAEQLELLKEIVIKFIVDRFGKEFSKVKNKDERENLLSELSMASDELLVAINDMILKVAVQPPAGSEGKKERPAVPGQPS
jgi:hypothetical protein